MAETPIDQNSDSAMDETFGAEERSFIAQINGTIVPELDEMIEVEDDEEVMNSNEAASQYEGGGNAQKNNPKPVEDSEKNVLWKRRYPRPFEIVYCDKGLMPLGPAGPPYGVYCDIPDCMQGVKVAVHGRNLKSKQAESLTLSAGEKQAKEGHNVEQEKQELSFEMEDEDQLPLVQNKDD